MKYTRLSEGLTKSTLIPVTEDVWDYVESNDKDYYTSIFEYNDEHYKTWKATNSVAGIKDVTTSRLVWDFDDADNLEQARMDALALSDRLIQNHIDPNNIQLTFSGMKGFGVELLTTETFTPEEFKNVTKGLASDLKTFDHSVSDPNRVVRLVGTKHNKSGFYKYPVSFSELKNNTSKDIKDKAANISNADKTVLNGWVAVGLPETISQLRVSKKVEVLKPTGSITDIDMSKKPRFLDTARWYLQNGFFGSGERNNALLCLAATYKNLGFEKEHTYRLLKGVAELQAKRNNVDRYSDKEIYNNILDVVYSNTWQGGQFSLKDENSWLYHYAKKNNIKIDDTGQKPTYMAELGGDTFAKYAKSFYETRIYTGLKDLDDAFPICAGSNVAIVGAASSGKTALTLNILKGSKDTVNVFASLDMSKSRLYEKMLYSVTKGEVPRDKLYQEYIAGKGAKYDEMVKAAFPSTFIFAKSSPTVDEMRNYIMDVQDHTGKAVRLLMVDYFERLGSERSDETAASKDVAGKIQDLISDFPELTPITLYQPNKMALGGGPDKPITNYSAIKGSSFIIQSARQILALWRPFFTPELKNYDRFMEMAILKNDLGELDKFVYNWKGKTGEITMPSDYDLNEYKEYMKIKEGKEDNDDLDI